MGAESFIQKGKGKTAQEAFNDARDKALYEYGHGGYTGSIAEKRSFKMITPPEGEDPCKYAYSLMDNGDSRIEDKWGPAGCIHIKDNEYLFFGYASS